MIEFKMSMIETIGLSVVLLIIGRELRRRINFFEKYCIPAPVIGGFLFSALVFVLRQTETVKIVFDTTLQTFFMVMFFTSVGFNASLKVLRKGGKKVFVFLLISALLCVLQNLVSVLLAGFVGLHPLLALMTGSTPLTGGHGTSAAIASTVEELGAQFATAKTIAIASATFGLVSGAMLGGPVANWLITKYKLLPSYERIRDNKHKKNPEEDINEEVLKKDKPYLDADRFSKAFFYILIAMGLGSYVSVFLNNVLGVKFPIYIGPMLVACLMRNMLDASTKRDAPIKEIGIIEEVALNLFLSMALMSLKLWELIDLAGPILILLVAQVVLMLLFLYFVTFKVMGSDYDAAVIASGHCGFGLGAVANGISNMKSVTEKYTYSQVAFFVVPIVGSLFIDFVNVGIITSFINFLK